GAGVRRLPDRRLVLVRERDAEAAGGRRLRLGLELLEEAQAPHGADVAAQPCGVEHRAGLGRQVHADGVILDLAIASELDPLDALAGEPGRLGLARGVIVLAGLRLRRGRRSEER